MPSNALKLQNYAQDNAPFAEESWEIKRKAIAREAEAASNLPGNNSGPELDEFVLHYCLKVFA